MVDDEDSFYLVKWIEKPWNVLDMDLVMSPIRNATKFLRVHSNVCDHFLPLHLHKLLP